MSAPGASWRPFATSGLIRSALAGTVVSAVVIAVYGTLMGEGPAFWIPLIGLATLVVAAYGILERRAERMPPWAFYVVPGGGGVILTLFLLLASPGAIFCFALFYALVAIVAGAGFPTRGQVMIHGVTAVSLVVTLVTLLDLRAVDLFVPVGLFLTTAWVASRYAQELRQAVVKEAAAAEEARLRADLLAAVSDIHQLDVDEAASAAVHAMADLGFAIATLGIVDHEAQTFVPIASHGMREEISAEPVPISAGVAGLALAERRLVEVPDYDEFAGRIPGRDPVKSGLGVPIFVGGRIEATLLGGRTVKGHCSPGEREVIQTIADQVGRAMENARRFELEHRAVARLEQLDVLKHEFVANVSHELRTPLTVMQGLGHTLEARHALMTSEQRRDLLERVASNARRLGSMVDAMMDLARIDTDGAPRALAPADLAEIAEATAVRLEPLLDERPFELSVESAVVACDRDLLEHVLENLIGNAVKHTPVGTPVRLAVRTEGDAAVVAVEDEGPGIHEKEVPLLTERFFRGDPGRRQPSSGLGLGLALVQQVLAQHGSRLEVGNRAEGGARFAFRLPLATPVAPTGSPAAAAAPASDAVLSPRARRARGRGLS